MEKQLEQAKMVIEQELARAGLKLVNLILFGSRAEGKSRRDSDWDFLVIVNQELDRKKMEVNYSDEKKISPAENS